MAASHATAAIPTCRGPIWNGVDLSECVRDRYLHHWLPYAALSISVSAVIAQRASKRKRRRATTQRIARLDPELSNIHLNHDDAPRWRKRRRVQGLLRRILTIILPLNGPQLATCFGLPYNEYSPLRSEEPPPSTVAAAQGTSAALAVFHTENAVIFNEVLRVMRDRATIEAPSHQRLSPEGVEMFKRVWEAVGSTALTGFSALRIISGDRRSTPWLLVWAYLAGLSFYTLIRQASFFKHKAFLFFGAFLVSLIDLRSAAIDSSDRNDLLLAGIYCTLCGLTLLPSIAFPYQSRLPMRLRTIQDTVQAQLPYQEARTAIPTPRARLSPSASSTDVNGHLEDASGPKENESLLPSPLNRASLLSRATFDFVTPAMLKHYRIQFTLDAVPDLPPGNHAASVVAAFRSDNADKVPEKQRTKCRGDGRDYATFVNDDHHDAAESSDADWSEHTRSGPPSEEQEHLSASQRPLAFRLARHFGGILLLQWMWAFIEAFASLTPAIALRLILGYIAERSHDQHITPLHVALLFPAFLALGQITSSIAASQALYTGRVICIRARAILVFEIVNKALRRRDTGGGAKEEEGPSKGLHNGKDTDERTSKRTTDGEVTNLVAVDVFRVSEIGAYLHFLFPETPVQITFCILLLVQLLGPAALVGVAVIVVCMPLQAYVARLFTTIQRKTLEATDNRLNLTNEVLNCIKTVKFFAWEEPFEKRLDETREFELKNLRYRWIIWIISYFLYLMIPIAVTLATFAVHTLYLHRPLPAETAFTALALFNTLRGPLEALPDMFVNVLSALVSLKRIDTFLREAETTKYEQLRPNEAMTASSMLGFAHASFTYSENDDVGNAFCLHDLNVTFPRDCLTIIAGPVGSGKTTLLMSLLGETRQIAGRTFMPCAVARSLIPTDPLTGLSETVAYCPQSPWLLGATIKENILFGQPYSEMRYRSVLKACALEADLSILEYDDETEVGEKGTALSGGQKARVALARAIYSPARYLLLDDVLSAVDAHTAKHLYRHCLKGPLMRGRTVVLVTHAVSLCLPGSALAIAVKDGRILTSGTPEEVQATGLFDDEIAPSGTQTPTSSKETVRQDNEEDDSPIVEEVDEAARQSKLAEIKTKQEKKALHANLETYGKGNVGTKAYKLYLTSFAATTVGLSIFWLLYIATFASARGTDIANAAWLRKWASTYEELRGKFTSGDADERTRFYLAIYGILSLAYMAASIGRDTITVYGSLQASRTLYRRLMGSIILAKPQWFDRTPIGRIMNRLSKDVEMIDQDIATQFVFFVDVCLQSAVIMFIACYTIPLFTIVAIVVVLLYWIVGALYVVSSRDLKRLESVTRSPIFTLVGEVLSGAVVIRAYGDASRFTRHCLRLIDKTNRPFYYLWAENRWLSVRVDVLAAIVSLAMAVFLILNQDVDAALAGFALSFTIQLVNAVLWVMRMYTTLEISANSVERVEEYLEVESEKQDGTPAPEGWPSHKGALVVDNFSARYSPELPRVLKNLSFRVEAGEKIGICGRTGSGKSTLALALFRFLEAEAGRIIVDGVDLSELRLRDIRSRLTIIPQESQLFSGTVRFNLDPFGLLDDSVLWDALERCKLAAPRNRERNSASGSGGPVTRHLRQQGRAPNEQLRAGHETPRSGTSTPRMSFENVGDELPTAVVSSLDMQVEQGGKNFSAGQKQLLALARGLLKLRKSNLIVLDESTASLDAGSDAAVQRTIRAEMRDATLLVVAHRIRGIVAFDKVLVLDAGQLVEFDKPSRLMRQEGSAFRDLCMRSGEFELLIQMADEADRERASAAPHS